MDQLKLEGVSQMSVGTTAANAATPNTANASEGDATESTETTAAPQETANARLLKESQENKRKYQELKARLDDEAKNKLVEQGKLKEALDLERSQAKEWKRNAIKFRLDSAIEKAAAKANCIKPEALLKLGNLGLLEMDEATLEVSGVEAFIEDARREHAYLFSSAKPPTINGTTPGGPVNNKPMSTADVAKLPADKKAAYWAQVMGKK